LAPVLPLRRAGRPEDAIMARKPIFYRLTVRRWLTLAVALVALAAVWRTRYPPRFNEEQFRRLELGMTGQEVVEVLGCPPGDYRPDVWKNPANPIAWKDPVGWTRTSKGVSFQSLGEMERQDVDDWVRLGKPVPPAPPRVVRGTWLGRYWGIEVAVNREDRVIHLSHMEMSPPRSPHELVPWVRWRLGL
jgi:hypothetical protein